MGGSEQRGGRIGRGRAAVVGAAVAVVACIGGLASPVAAVAPTGQADRYVAPGGGVVRADAASGVLANDGGGADRRAERAGRPAHGSLQLAGDGSFTYRADAGFEGLDTFTYRVADEQGTSAPITVEVLINRAPRTQPDTYSIPVDGRLRRAAPGVQANDLDVVGAPVQTYLFGGASHGRATLSVDGRLVYVPDPGFQGTDRFRYVSRDAYGRWSLATTITVRVGANRAPVAVADDLTMSEDSIFELAAPGLLANDTDADGDSLTAELVGAPSSGTVDLQPDGSVAIGTEVNGDADITFRYRVFDGLAWSAPVTIVVDVIAENDPPVAEGDQYDAFGRDPLEVPAPGVLANDSDPVEFDGLRAELATPPSTGTVVLAGDGSFTYVPDPGPSRGDSFTYRACDSGGCTLSSVDLSIFVDET